jgi:hypothetical protein
MKTNLLAIVTSALLLSSFARPAVAATADTNPPPRLTIELRDGSRVVGQSVEKNFKFHSALLGDVKLAVPDLRLIDCVSTNSAKLITTDGDTLTVSFVASAFAVKTSFGQVELPVNSIRRISVATAGHPPTVRPGLLAFWSGNGHADDSTGHHHGVLMGGANYALGPSGQAFNFDAPGSFVKIPHSSDLNPGGQVTVEFWMNADAANAMNTYQGLVTSDFYGVEISNGYGGKMGVNFFLNNGLNQPMPRFGFNGQGSSGFRSPRFTSVANFTHISDANGGGAAVTAGRWHHVAATYDGAQLRLFMDGQPWGRPMPRPGAIAPMLPESFVAIGSEDGRTTCSDCIGQRYFKGSIADVALYNRALSPAEIREDFEAGKAN